jgi:hypothetical protein
LLWLLLSTSALLEASAAACLQRETFAAASLRRNTFAAASLRRHTFAAASLHRHTFAMASGNLEQKCYFARSPVTDTTLAGYEKKGYFPKGWARAPKDDEVVPKPEANESVVYEELFVVGLRAPCHPVVPKILEKFNLQVH